MRAFDLVRTVCVGLLGVLGMLRVAYRFEEWSRLYSAINEILVREMRLESLRWKTYQLNPPVALLVVDRCDGRRAQDIGATTGRKLKNKSLLQRGRPGQSGDEA
jgi:hypothetical protein